MNPIISVIVPCYNQEKYLHDGLNSVLQQSLHNWECVIVNDGSTDSSMQIAKEYAEKDSRFLIVEKTNGGICEARNFGIKASHGKYILPLDADDKIGETYLQKAVEYMEKHPEMKLVYCLADFFGETNGPCNLPKYDYTSMLWNNPIFCSAVYRRSDYDETIGYNPNMKFGHEDWDFWLTLLSEADSVYCIPETLFFYRKHGISRSTGALQHVYLSNTQMIKNHWDLYEPYLADMFEYRKTKYDYDLALEWNKHLENELNGILNSKAYKLGKVFLSPFQFLHRLIKK